MHGPINLITKYTFPSTFWRSAMFKCGWEIDYTSGFLTIVAWSSELHALSCSLYGDTFRRNHISGEPVPMEWNIHHRQWLPYMNSLIRLYSLCWCYLQYHQASFENDLSIKHVSPPVTPWATRRDKTFWMTFMKFGVRFSSIELSWVSWKSFYMLHPRCVLCKSRWGRYVKTHLSLYPIYYADDDMFRPLWAILRSQKYIMRKKSTGKIISCGTYSEL